MIFRARHGTGHCIVPEQGKELVPEEVAVVNIAELSTVLFSQHKLLLLNMKRATCEKLKSNS